jgi:L-ascorbate 6-phosphate lactonase
MTLKMRWLGQAGFRLDDADTLCAIIDPFISEFPGRLIQPQCTSEELSEADAIIISHQHADHFDAPVLRSMRPSNSLVILPAPLGDLARHEGITHHVIGARPGEAIPVGNSLSIHPVASKHGVHVHDAYDFGSDELHGDPRYLGYVLDFGSTRLYHSGDSLDYPGLADELRRLRVDIAFLPINGRDAEREAQDIVGNMNVAEVVDLVGRAGIRCVVPMHYEMFANNLGPLDLFVESMRSKLPLVHIIIPSTSGSLPLPSALDLTSTRKGSSE